MPRYYRIEEAEAVLPDVEDAIRSAIGLKAEMGSAEAEMDKIKERIYMAGGTMINREQVLELRNRREESAAELKETMDRIEGFGCLVKDLDIGLLDFPTLYRGEEVYLCWRLGEPAILFWHGVTEGFRGRKIIDNEFRANHQGSAGQ
ncbi:MAG: DUF2203 domain-containing protein [Bryobacteraceae bacterium]